MNLINENSYPSLMSIRHTSNSLDQMQQSSLYRAVCKAYIYSKSLFLVWYTSSSPKDSSSISQYARSETQVTENSNLV